MGIDWSVVATIAAPIIALFVGMAITRVTEQKPNLIAYFTHSSVFNLAGDHPATIHTHGIVVKNIGRKPATDVRVRHSFLPANFNIYPVVAYQVQNQPNGTAEIVFPTLVPNEQVSIAYLYFPPVVYNQIHAGIRHSDGFATEVTALPTTQYPSWMLKGFRFLLALGLVAFGYLIVEGIHLAIRVSLHK